MLGLYRRDLVGHLFERRQGLVFLGGERPGRAE